MKKPNFFIVGAAKAGTTSIFNYLNNHPDVYMSPIKEPHYFSKDISCEDFSEEYKKKVCFDIKAYLSKPQLEKKHIAFVDNINDYLELFREVYNEKVIGEISNGYLFSKVASKEIFEFNPKAKILIILRNPVERAFSHWLMDLRGGLNLEKDFLKAIEKDYNQKEKGWGKSHLYIELGLYYEQIKRYLDTFPKEQVKIMFFDDLKKDSKKFMNEIFEYLDLNPIELDTNKRYNKAQLPKNRLIYNLAKNIYSYELVKKLIPGFISKKIKNKLMTDKDLPKLTERERKILYDKYFKEDIDKLERLINYDLTMWKY